MNVPAKIHRLVAGRRQNNLDTLRLGPVLHTVPTGVVVVEILPVAQPNPKKLVDFRVHGQLVHVDFVLHVRQVTVLRDHHIIVGAEVPHRLPVRATGDPVVDPKPVVVGHRDGPRRVKMHRDQRPVVAEPVHVELGHLPHLARVRDDPLPRRHFLNRNRARQRVHEGAPRKTRRHLLAFGPRVVQTGRPVNHLFERKGCVCLGNPNQVAAVHGHRQTHEHHLGTLVHLALDGQQVRTLQGLEPEIVNQVVAAVVAHGVQLLGVVIHVLHEIVVQQMLGVQLLHGLGERIRRVAVMVGNDEPTGERTVVVVDGGHGGALLRGNFVYFIGLDAVKQLVNDFNHERRVIDLDVGLFAHLLDALQDFIKRYDFLLPVALGHVHLGGVFKDGHGKCSG